MADIRAKLKAEHPHPNPDVQADCLRVYRREKKAGTEFTAILDAIDDEVQEPLREKRWKEQAQRERDRKQRLLESGNDFGFIPRIRIDPNPRNRIDPNKADDWYARYAGQYYRLERIAPHDYTLFAIAKVGDRGAPTKPHSFRSPTEARAAIRAGKVKT
jgi:hypothetical protein